MVIKIYFRYVLILLLYFNHNFRYNNLIEILKITENEDIIKMISTPERLAIEIDNIKKNI